MLFNGKNKKIVWHDINKIKLLFYNLMDNIISFSKSNTVAKIWIEDINESWIQISFSNIFTGNLKNVDFESFSQQNYFH